MFNKNHQISEIHLQIYPNGSDSTASIAIFVGPNVYIYIQCKYNIYIYIYVRGTSLYYVTALQFSLFSLFSFGDFQLIKKIKKIKTLFSSFSLLAGSLQK